MVSWAKRSSKNLKMNVLYLFCLMGLLWFGVLGTSAFAEEPTINLYVGQSFEIKSYLMSETEIKLGTSSWRSFNADVVSVSSSGTLKAQKVGETYVTATTTSGGVIKDVKIKVVVVSGVGALELDQDKLSMVMGESETLTAHFVAYNGVDKIYDQKIKWSTSSSKVVSVDDAGKITAMGEGTAYITATSSDGNKTAKCSISVKSVVKSIRFSESDLTLNFGDTKPLSVLFTPEDAPVKSVTYRTTNAKIAEVNQNGIITAKGTGSCMISAMSTDGKRYTTLSVNVVSMLSGIKLDKTSLSLDSVKDRDQLMVTLVPKNEKELPLVSDVTWASSNTTVATVDKNGLVKAVGTGRATITATAADGGYQAKCDVTSTLKSSLANGSVPAMMINLLDVPETAYLGQKVAIDFTVSPVDATERTASVTVDPASSVSVISNPGHFIFTPTKTGITAVTVKVGNASARFTLKVLPSVNNLSIESKLEGTQDGKYVYLGQEVKLTAKFDLSAFKLEDLDTRTMNWRYASDYLAFRADPQDPYSVYVKLLKPVNTPVTVEFFDGLVIKRLNLIYEPMAQSMTLADTAQVNLNYAFSPELSLVPKSNLRYGYNDVLDPSADMYLEEIYIATDFVKNEINYELENLPSLLKQASTKPTGSSERNSLMSEWQKHSARLKAFEALIVNGKEEYQQIKTPGDLTDRNLNKMKLFELSGGKLTTAVNGKALVRVVSRDGHFEKKMWIYAKAQAEDLILMDAAGNILATSSDRAQKALETKAQMEALKTLNALKGKFTGYAEGDLPSADQIGVVYQALQSQLIGLNDFKGKYRNAVTKLDALKVFVTAYEQVSGKKMKSVSSTYFTDVTNPYAEKAYQLGLVKGNKARTLSPNQILDKTMVSDMAKLWLKASKKKLDDKSLGELIGGSGDMSAEDFIVFVYKLMLKVK